ncbi:NAD(P)H-binding protein [Nonomuraea sp. NPDC050404]|uniref:NAD(P)H-binding protein n=1 Tax=Nonomuraea sp. NPDC050404 TaxID=3155783 RepID=UPI0033D034B7
MTILITGASGNIGGGVARRLAAAGRPIVLAARDPGSVTAPRGCPPDIRRLDYDDPSSYEGALRRATSVLLIAPPADACAHERMRPFIRAMTVSEVAHVVVVSAVMAETDEDFPLRRVEREVERAGHRFTHLRSQWYMNSLTSGVFAPMAAAGEIALPAGHGRVAFVDPADVAGAAAAVLTEPARHHGRAYALTGPEPFDWACVAEMCSEFFGHAVRYLPITDDAYRTACRGAGIPAPVAEFLIGLYTAIRAGHAARTTTAVRWLTGRPPRGLREFLTEAAAVGAIPGAGTRPVDSMGDGR